MIRMLGKSLFAVKAKFSSEPSNNSISETGDDATEISDVAHDVTQEARSSDGDAAHDLNSNQITEIDADDLSLNGLQPNEVVTAAMIEEEKILHEHTLMEESELRMQAMQTNGVPEREDCYKRLQYLLQKSNMYTEYLLKRMKEQQLEDEQKQQQNDEKKQNMMRQTVKKEDIQSDHLHEADCQEDSKSRALSEIRGISAHSEGRTRKTRQTDPSNKDDEECKTVIAGDRKRKLCDTLGLTDVTNEQSSKKLRVEASDSVQDDLNKSEDLQDNVEKNQQEDADLLISSNRFINGEKASDGQPALFSGGVLRKYQIEGLRWLNCLYENGVNGILADEMGLGKTIQCIAAMCHIISQKVLGPFLIVAPLSTLPNWFSEFKRFAPKIPVILYHGSKDQRALLKQKIHKLHKVTKTISILPVVITSYEIAMNDRSKIQNFVWKYLIVDEGHRIKNAQCKLIRELRMYKSTHRLLLTGTPLQNNMAELWSLLNFLLPEIFDDLNSFETWFSVDEIMSGDADQRIIEEERRNSVLSMLHQILTPFLLRRLKCDIDLCIPPKRQLVVYAPLTKSQQDLYEALVNKHLDAIMEKKETKIDEVQLDSKGRPVRKTAKKVNYEALLDMQADEKNEEDDENLEAWIKALSQSHKNSTESTKLYDDEPKTVEMNVRLHNVMMQLRKVCNHPYLLKYPLNSNGDYLIDQEVIKASGKMLLLDRLLPQLQKTGHKVLLFSQMTKMLDILEDYCYLKKYKYCRLDGSTRMEDRQSQMHDFNTESELFIFLLSTRAGGLGINLTAADTVIIFDSDWNPQCDLQAQDRCHRIGQTSPVLVYRLVTANTIDQKIVERAAGKRKLEKMIIHKRKFKGGLQQASSAVNPVTPQELLELLKSQDHEDTFHGRGKQVISNRDLDKLLDRQDLYDRWLNSQDSQDGKQLTRKKKQTSKDVRGVFKIVDEDDSNSGFESVRYKSQK